MIPAFTRYRSSGGGGDPYFSNVALLLHLNGANGSTSFPDSSSHSLSIAGSGSAAISTAQSKFNGSSLSLPGGSALYGTTYDSALNLNAPGTSFTVECWAYLTSNGGDPYIVTANSSGNSPRWAMQVYSGRLAFYSGGGSAPPNGSLSIPLNQWVHLAVSYDASTDVLKTFVGGVQDYSGAGVLVTGTAAMRAEIGAAYFNNSNFMNGYLAEVRVTKGVSRYSSSFTPPSSPFPDHA